MFNHDTKDFFIVFTLKQWSRLKNYINQISLWIFFKIMFAHVVTQYCKLMMLSKAEKLSIIYRWQHIISNRFICRLIVIVNQDGWGRIQIIKKKTSQEGGRSKVFDWTFVITLGLHRRHSHKTVHQHAGTAAHNGFNDCPFAVNHWRLCPNTQRAWGVAEADRIGLFVSASDTSC